MIIAGEASGDLHAAKLVQAAHASQSDIEFYGIGGPNMQKAGVKILVDCSQMAVVGIAEIWAQRKVIFAALRQMREELANKPPDLLLLVDYPEFNLRLAKTAKQYSIKVLFYISPQVWAWRQHRVKKIRDRVDMMAVVFPFEEAFYLQHHVPVKFVGHPLVDEVRASASREVLLAEFGLNATNKIVGLFPGSRRSELKRLLPVILKSARLIQSTHPDTHFLLPLAPSISESELEPQLSAYSDLKILILKQRAYDVMTMCDVIITVSGTVTLEIALVGTPMVIINKVSVLTYAIVHRMLKTDHIGLCNIIAGKEITPELIQHNATPENISNITHELLINRKKREKIKHELSEIEGKLGARGGISNIANLVIEMLA